jgi:hypothetical protein
VSEITSGDPVARAGELQHAMVAMCAPCHFGGSGVTAARDRCLVEACRDRDCPALALPKGIPP